MIERVLVAGLGSIGARHLKLLREALPFADIRVLRHAGCAGDLPEESNGCFDSLEAAALFSPQAAVISNPAPFHLDTARALADSGAHLLVEKPLSDTAAGGADLVALCQARGRVLQVGYNLRFLETLQYFRAELAAEAIGTVYSVRCEIGQYLPGWRPGTDYRTSVSARNALGGGALLELSHEFDMLRWVFGEIDWLSAWTGRQGTLEIDVEDCAMVQFGFEGGAVAQLGMDFLRRDTTRVCTVIGEAGSLRWDAVVGSVSRFDPHADSWREVKSQRPEQNASYRAQIAAFLHAIATGRPDEVAAGGTDGLAVMRLVDAARHSDAEGGCRIVI